MRAGAGRRANAVRLVVDVLADEPDGAVAHQEMDAADVRAGESGR
jgi:hypothetical protein